jgi:hypothetical protein
LTISQNDKNEEYILKKAKNKEGIRVEVSITQSHIIQMEFKRKTLQYVIYVNMLLSLLLIGVLLD